jgi:hypothetical protein
LSRAKSLLTQALMLTPAQLRAARALVSWSRDTLGEKSDTSPETVTGFETRGSDPKRSTMLKWKRALEQAGVEFLEPTDDGKGEGVRFKSAKGKR